MLSEIEQVLPSEIEKRSFEIITEELKEMGKILCPETELIVKRCIHTSADFEYADSLVFTEGVVEKAKDAIRRGVPIITDTQMGKAGINRVSLATSQAFYNMVFEDETLRDFIYTRLEKADTDNEWNPLISTGTQANLNADKVKSFRILLPSSDERRLIAKYFADLDSLITLHQRKLELLRNIKKSMLDKMFV